MFVVALIAIVLSASVHASPLPVPRATLNLDVDPGFVFSHFSQQTEHRWDTILHSVISTYGWNYTFQPALDVRFVCIVLLILQYIEKTLPPEVLSLIDNGGDDVENINLLQ